MNQMLAVFQHVRSQVEQQAPGTLVALDDFAYSPEQAGAFTKALSRLYKQGILRRLIKGMYYKPVHGILGEIPPSYDKILKKLLAVYKYKISYVTGINVYSELGLTTQVAKEFVIASDKPRSAIKIGSTEVRFIRSHVLEAVEDVMPLQLLDALWEIKDIPANQPTQAAQVLLGQFGALNSKQLQALTDCALSYPPQTRALAGLLLDTLGKKTQAAQLKASLNSQTTFRISLDEQVFPNKKSWRIL